MTWSEEEMDTLLEELENRETELDRLRSMPSSNQGDRFRYNLYLKY